MQEFWAGLAIERENDRCLKIGIAIHDGTYGVDFAVHRVSLEEEEESRKNGDSDWVADHVIEVLSNYRREHMCKILGAGVIPDLHGQSPMLCSRLWSELDIVPIVVTSNPILRSEKGQSIPQRVDEIADSAARKCVAWVFHFRFKATADIADFTLQRNSHA